jgi:hypothetical protein
MARESRKERDRETAGTLCGKVTPLDPGAQRQVPEIPRDLPEGTVWSLV